MKIPTRTIRRPNAKTFVRVVDLGAREVASNEALQVRISELGSLSAAGKLNVDQQAELARLKDEPTVRWATVDAIPVANRTQPEKTEFAELQGAPPYDDQLFRHVRELDKNTGTVAHDGKGGFSRPLDDAEKAVIAIYGIMLRGNLTERDTGARYRDGLARARQEYRDNRPLYDKVLNVLEQEGDQGQDWVISARDWATVTHSLVEDHIDEKNRNLALRVRAALAGATGADETTNPSAILIDLPDLEAETAVDIVEANLHALQAIYFAGTLEEARLFAVMDKIVELFNQGVLPLSRGSGGDLIFRYWKKSNERFTEVERRNLYARSFGWPGGEAVQTAVNREFNDLWLRFISAVASFSRQLTLDDLLRSASPGAVSQEQVRKAGRDLAANLSLYGYGMAYFAATELQTVIREIIAVLSDDEVKACYGARDMWQVVDQVATLELGGARNSVRYRTMAQSGAVIIRWLAKNGPRLSAVGGLRLLDEVSLRLQRNGSSKPTVDPNDQDLVDACQQWLAVTGTPEARIEQYAQPVETGNTTSRPIAIPAVARDLLDAAGVNGFSAN